MTKLFKKRKAPSGDGAAKKAKAAKEEKKVAVKAEKKPAKKEKPASSESAAVGSGPNSELASLFAELASHYFSSGNRFKGAALKKVAKVLGELPDKVEVGNSFESVAYVTLFVRAEWKGGEKASRRW